jgi:hypothetical protein
MRLKERSLEIREKGAVIYERDAAFGTQARRMLVMTRGMG